MWNAVFSFEALIRLKLQQGGRGQDTAEVLDAHRARFTSQDDGRFQFPIPLRIEELFWDAQKSTDVRLL